MKRVIIALLCVLLVLPIAFADKITADLKVGKTINMGSLSGDGGIYGPRTQYIPGGNSDPLLAPLKSSAYTGYSSIGANKAKYAVTINEYDSEENTATITIVDKATGISLGTEVIPVITNAQIFTEFSLGVLVNVKRTSISDVLRLVIDDSTVNARPSYLKFIAYLKSQGYDLSSCSAELAGIPAKDSFGIITRANNVNSDSVESAVMAKGATAGFLMTNAIGSDKKGNPISVKGPKQVFITLKDVASDKIVINIDYPLLNFRLNDVVIPRSVIDRGSYTVTSWAWNNMVEKSYDCDNPSRPSSLGCVPVPRDKNGMIASVSGKPAVTTKTTTKTYSYPKITDVSSLYGIVIKWDPVIDSKTKKVVSDKIKIFVGEDHLGTFIDLLAFMVDQCSLSCPNYPMSAFPNFSVTRINDFTSFEDSDAVIPDFNVATGLYTFYTGWQSFSYYLNSIYNLFNCDSYGVCRSNIKFVKPLGTDSGEFSFNDFRSGYSWPSKVLKGFKTNSNSMLMDGYGYGILGGLTTRNLNAGFGAPYGPQTNAIFGLAPFDFTYAKALDFLKQKCTMPPKGAAEED